MIIGVPKEVKEDEYRVGILPAGVRTLTEHGHTVLIECGAGEGSRIEDEDFSKAGAKLTTSIAEVYGSSQMIMKVKEPQESEYGLLQENQIIYAYFHLAAEPELTAELVRRKVTAVAFETIQLNDGSLPLLTPMSEVAGRMAIQVGAHFLEKPQGGRGVLLAGVPGVKRGRVTIVGAGSVGRAATQMAVGLGTEVHVLDIDVRRLLYLDDLYGNRITTIFSNYENLRDSIVNSHLVVGAVLIPGARAPRIVTEKMVRMMKPGSVIVDVAVDQGGCVETTRPTTHQNPIFKVGEVLHYCVSNMPGAVARTSTFALNNATLPYAVKLVDQPFHKAVAEDSALAKGVNVYGGHVTYENVASDLGYPYTSLSGLLADFF